MVALMVETKAPEMVELWAGMMDEMLAETKVEMKVAQMVEPMVA